MERLVRSYRFFKSTRNRVLFFTALVFISACKKENKPAPAPQDPIPAAQNQPDLSCADLPPAPRQFGWKDTSAGVDKSINAFFFNPLNHDEVIFIVNGDLFGYNKMYNYNIPRKQSRYICDNGNELPRVNSKGWIVFNRSDLNIYKVKTNGDSLQQLTNTHLGHDARWDRYGNRIFFYQDASANFPAALVEMDKRGTLINTTPAEFANTAFANTRDRIAYLKSNGSTLSVYYRDLAANSETLVTSAQGNAAEFLTLFNNLTFDNTDENLYWSNDKGIFKCNIATGKPELILKNCQSITYDRPLVASSNELTLGAHVMKPISSTQLLHQYRAIEYDPNTKQVHELRIFPQ